MKNAIGRPLPFFGAACTLGMLLPLSVNRRAPYAQIIGHYAPLSPVTGPRLVAVGTDSECDLGLTETGVADVHGRIELRSDGGCPTFTARRYAAPNTSRRGAYPPLECSHPTIDRRKLGA